MSTGILGIGSYLPDRVIDNNQIGEWIGQSPEWILSRTGIVERRYCEPDVSTSDMAMHAVENLFAAAPDKRGAIGAVITATGTPDHQFPSVAAIVQGRAQLGRGPAFDLNAACTGFLYSFVMADSLLSTQDDLDEVLIVCSETVSKLLNRADRKTVTVFGDAAAACRVGRVPDGYGILAHKLIADGGNSHFVGLPAGGSRQPLTEENVNSVDRYLLMNGRAVREYFEEVIPKLAADTVAAAGLSMDDIDCFAFHQANPQMLRDIIGFLGLDPAKCPLPGVHFGNVGSASIPMVLESTKPKRGDHILMAAVGAGMTAGAVVVKWY